jgi:hypothetical protein
VILMLWYFHLPTSGETGAEHPAPSSVAAVMIEMTLPFSNFSPV